MYVEKHFPFTFITKLYMNIDKRRRVNSNGMYDYEWNGMEWNVWNGMYDYTYKVT